MVPIPAESDFWQMREGDKIKDYPFVRLTEGFFYIGGELR
jgi:hypothetical protein